MRPREGFVQGAKNPGDNFFSGRMLLALRDHALLDSKTMGEATALMRRVLATHLGDKPLKTRELL